MESGGSKTFKALDAAERVAVLNLAAKTDFRMFGSVEVLTLLNQHRETPFYSARFGGGLPPRPKPEGPPAEIHESERIYVTKLLAAYDERYTGIDTVAAAEAHAKAAGHFRRQRESFFRAEALKSFARDSVPSVRSRASRTSSMTRSSRRARRTMSMGWSAFVRR